MTMRVISVCLKWASFISEIYILFAMAAHYKIFLVFEVHSFKNIRICDLIFVVAPQRIGLPVLITHSG